MESNPRVLLTGGSGFLGRNVLSLLARKGIITIAAGRVRPQGVPACRFMEVDLLGPVNFTELVKSSRASHLVHLAWYAEHGLYWSSQQNLRWVDATVRLCEAFCMAGGKRIVVAGTCAEYDWSHGYCNETNTPLNPATLYGIAKDATRRLVNAVCIKHGVPCVWGRVFLPYGLGEDGRRLIPALVDVFEGKRAPFGVNANAYRDFLHVEDVAAGFCTLLDCDVGGAFNICSGEPVRIAEVVALVAKSRNADPQLVLDLPSDRPGEPDFLVGDNNKILKLGWRTRHKLLQIGTKENG